MAKYAPKGKLSSEQEKELFVEFCQALSTVHKPVEAAQFIKDLLSIQEVRMLAKRLQIAKSLIDGMTYGEICRELKVGMTTVAKISYWLETSGEGYRLVIKRGKNKNKSVKIEDPLKQNDPFSFQRMKKRYPMHFWPENLIEEIIKSSDRKQKKKFREALQKLNEKFYFYKYWDKVFINKYRPKNNQQRLNS